MTQEPGHRSNTIPKQACKAIQKRSSISVQAVHESERAVWAIYSFVIRQLGGEARVRETQRDVISHTIDMVVLIHQS